MTKTDIQKQALQNAKENNSLMNYSAIISGFMEKGINANDILPRENVFTFHAWKALNRVVKKGEKGVRIVTFIPTEKVNTETGEIERGTFPKNTTVFHISQTEELTQH